MNFVNEKNIKLALLIFGTSFFCYFISIANVYFSNNIDEAIIINETINIPIPKSPQLEFSYDIKNLLIYFIIFLLKIGFDYLSISQILLFISTLFFFMGIFLILKNLISCILKKFINFIAFVSTCLFVLSDTHLPHTDYPNAYFGEFTTGIYSIAISTLIFGLIIDGRKRLALFFSLTLFLIHPLQGSWIISVFIILEFFEKIFIKKNYDNVYLKKLFFLIIGLIFTISLIIINNYLGENLVIDKDLINIWLNDWDAHRNNLKIKYHYLKPTFLLLILSIICFYLFKKNKNENLYRFYLFTIITIILSTAVYVGYKIFYNFLPFFLIGPMPSRVINTHAMIAYPTIIMTMIIIVNYMSQIIKLKNNILLIFFCISLLTFYLFNHKYENLNDRFSYIYKNRFEKNFLNFLNNFNLKETDLYDEVFWNKVSKLDDDFYTIITHSTENLSFRYAKKPHIIKITSFDYVPYYPASVTKTFEILTTIYGAEIYGQKKPLNEKNIKAHFEKRTNFEWQKIKNIFNTKYVVVPNYWKIDLNKILFSEQFAVYEIQ